MKNLQSIIEEVKQPDSDTAANDVAYHAERVLTEARVLLECWRYVHYELNALSCIAAIHGNSYSSIKVQKLQKTIEKKLEDAMETLDEFELEKQA